MFSTDQILLARILADREGCFIHSSGVDFNGQGVLFVGHSGAGKSTMIKMLKGRVDILCDDRVIVRRHQEGFRIHGTWSHGEVPDVSAASAPLKVIYFLHQAKENRVELVANQGEIVRCLLACLIKPFATCDWWEKTLPIIEQIAHTTSAYKMFFDKSGDIVNILSGERV